jgi:hypothetical protein
MNALITLLQWMWQGVASFFTWVKDAVPQMFNKVWAAGILIVGLVYTMISKASSLLGNIADRLDGVTLAGVAGHAPTGGGSATGGTIRNWLEIGNAIFPINETFTYLIAYLALLASLFVIALIWKLVSKVW